MKSRLFFLILLLVFFIPSITIAKIATGALYSLGQIKVVAPHLAIRPPKAHFGERPDFSRVLNYYRKLNHIIVRRNPVLDAKKALSEGHIEFLTSLGSFDGVRIMSNNMLSKNGEPTSVWSRGIPSKLVQGSGFDHYISGFGKRYPAENKVLDIYAQSAFRYAYYWNRTVGQYLDQKKGKKNIPKIKDSKKASSVLKQEKKGMPLTPKNQQANKGAKTSRSKILQKTTNSCKNKKLFFSQQVSCK